jgi:hypothetical protein
LKHETVLKHEKGPKIKDVSMFQDFRRNTPIDTGKSGIFPMGVLNIIS